MGNTPSNTPFEDRFVERVVEWWMSLRRRIGRRSSSVRTRATGSGESGFAPRSPRTGIAVQEASYTDFEQLATLLQHCGCVVANAGTILLDALVNDRPSVCVLYDEGAPPGESYALKNLIGEHYRELAESSAFYRAASFEEVVEGIGRALAHPEELADERRRVALRVVGEVDGHAGERVVDAIVGLPSPTRAGQGQIHVAVGADERPA